MSSAMQQSLGPSSSAMERDARRIHDDTPYLPKYCLGVVIGRAAEFFDFFVYGIASVVVFPQLFFPFAPDRLTATLYSFAIFSLAFVARPVGSLVFMAIDRTYGRGVKLTIALFLLGGSTASIAFLPGYPTLGAWSIVLLAVFRLGQGFALGGAWDGLASLLALNAPQHHRGWYAMIPQLGAPLGFMLASALFAYFLVSISEADFLAWGWRYPFFVAFAINVVALFTRLRLVMTKEFGTLLDVHELQAARVTEVLRVNGGNVLVGAFVPLASFALFHLVTVFPLSWVEIYTDHGASSFLMVQFLGAVCGILAIIASGLIADRIGRRNHLGICAVLIAIFSFVAPMLLQAGATGRDVFVIVGFTILGLSLARPRSRCSRFGKAYRYTGAALTSDLSWLIGAGFAPLVALGLTSRFGLAFAGYYLLSGALCTILALVFSKKLEIDNE
ncbi:arabinose ABC transporter permease [Sinorhizobium meliloti CCBAU 01290]|nr:arabinose ABC transporter permease [Sinorhizobium meliloti CCBAU 01290]